MANITKRIDNRRGTVHKTSQWPPYRVTALRESANRQEKIIARWFWANRAEAIGPSHLHEAMGLKWPLTSTRRAINTLTLAEKPENRTDKQVLIKTGQTCASRRGGIEHKWRAMRPEEDAACQPQQSDMFGGTPEQNQNGVYSR